VRRSVTFARAVLSLVGWWATVAVPARADSRAAPALQAPALQAPALQAPALHWTRAPGAEGCIDPASLALRVEQFTGPVLARPSGARRHIEGHIEPRAGGGYHARITVARGTEVPSGERVLDHASADCRALDGALSFVIAILIDPELSLEALPPELLALASREVPAAELLVQELEMSVPAAASDTSLEVARAAPSKEDGEAADTPKQALEPPSSKARDRTLGLLAVGEFSVMPEALVGLAVLGSYEATRQWSLLASVRGAFSPRTMELDTGAFDVARGSAIDASLAACGGTEPEPSLRLRACLGPEYSLWLLRGLSFEQGDRARLHGLGITLTLELRYRLGVAFSLLAFGAVRVNLLSASFVYDAGQVAYEIPRVSLVAGLGPSYAF
jgi:hypothetical protein